MLDSIPIEPPAAAKEEQSIETLGKDIVARIEAGEKAKSKSDEYFKSAGLQLIEAKKRVPDFKAFLEKHCNNLSRSRAYELIKIAGGKIDEVRTKTKERTRRHRVRAAQAKTEAVSTQAKTEAVSATQRTPTKVRETERALAEFKVAADIWMAKMDSATKQQALTYVQGKVARQSYH